MSSFFQRIRQRLTSTSSNNAANNTPTVSQVEITDQSLSVANEAAINQPEEVQENPQVEESETVQSDVVEEPMASSPQQIDETIEQQPEETQNEAEEDTKNVDEEVASTIPDEPQPSRWRDDLYIQTRKNFQRTTKEAFALNQFMSEMPPIISMEMHYYRSVNTAILIQTIFHNFALIIQGFLSGFALFHTIIAFAFVDVVSLVKGYQYMAAPMHATFYFCFVISAIDAMDRFETGDSWKQTLGRLIGLQKGGLGLVIAFFGTATTVVMTKFEEYLATNLNNDDTPQTASINAWHWLSAIRSVCAIAGWLLIALQPTANHTRDELLAMVPEMRNNRNIDATNLSSESNRLANAKVISSLANSVARLDLSQDFLTSIKVLASHQANN